MCAHMRHVPIAAALLFACACGPKNNGGNDAGPDTSCGLDCAAQSRFGLIVNRCFEYSSDSSQPPLKQDPPALGVLVLPVATIEGGVQVLPVEYRQLGQIKMRDSFAIKGGALYLARREFTASGRSVTYRDSQANIVGAKWLGLDTGAGETLSTDVQAFIVNQTGAGTTESTSYRVTTAEATFSELRAPLMTYDAGVKVLVGETPDHGSDPRRVYVPDVGFVVIASPFSLAGGTPTPLSLQKVRELGGADAGADCSLGVP